MKRTNISTGTEWERKVAYSRAVKVGNTIEIAGTVASNGTQAVHIGDPYNQTIFILNKIKDSLEVLGSSLNEVVRTRMFVTNIELWEEVGLAHGKIFSGINPVTTMVEVSSLIHSDYMVEIEATAIMSNR